MELDHEFEVAGEAAGAWQVLTDLAGLAACVPGIELDEALDDEFRGTMAVQFGPISARYRGGARFEERNDEAYRAVLRATGRDPKGNGNAALTLTAVLEPLAEGTKVSLRSELEFTGKVVRLGDEILTATATGIFEQFVANLHASLLPPLAAVAAAVEAPAEEPLTSADEAAPVAAAPRRDDEDLDGAGRPSPLRRLLPAALGAAVLALAAAGLSRLRRRVAARG